MHTSKSTETLPEIPEKTVPEFLLAKAKQHAQNGKDKFLEDGLSGESRHFKDFENETRRIASYFHKHGLKKGDIVIYMTSYQIQQIILMTGVWRANGVMRSLYEDESSEVIAEKLKESEARWIFCDADAADNCKNIADSVSWPVEVIVCGPGKGKDGFRNFAELLLDDGCSCPELMVSEDDPALILPTSGTTGASKGAVHAHKSVLTIIRAWENFPLFETNIIASKGTHISGAMFPLTMLSKGVLGIVLHKVDKEILIRTVDKYKPGLVFAFPTFLLALASKDADGYDMTSIQVILTGGSPITEEMHKTYLTLPNVNHVVILFGMTENPNVAATVDFSKNGDKTCKDTPIGSVGKPYPGGELKIKDLESNEILGPNKKGEILSRDGHQYTFKGYFKDPERTKDAFLDGWVRTGDIGYLDENGFLFVVDRAKDIFKYFHNHISPTELENVINQHQEVKEVCVFPVPSEGGEVPRAFVILKNPEPKNFSEMAKKIKEFADDKVADYKKLRGGLYIVEELPKGKSGKIERRSVAKMELPTY